MIDYNLVEKIGATHYASGVYYKAVDELLQWRNGRWEQSTSNASWMLNVLKPIPPKPQVRFEYELAGFNKASEAVVAWENGDELFVENPLVSSQKYLKAEFSSLMFPQKLYRRVEKVVDWSESVVEILEGYSGVSISKTFSNQIKIGGVYTKEQAIELAKAILRAAGEL